MVKYGYGWKPWHLVNPKIACFYGCSSIPTIRIINILKSEPDIKIRNQNNIEIIVVIRSSNQKPLSRIDLLQPL